MARERYQLNVELPGWLAESLTARSVSSGVPKARLVRDALQRFLDVEHVESQPISDAPGAVATKVPVAAKAASEKGPPRGALKGTEAVLCKRCESGMVRRGVCTNCKARQ